MPDLRRLCRADIHHSARQSHISRPSGRRSRRGRPDDSGGACPYGGSVTVAAGYGCRCARRQPGRCGDGDQTQSRADARPRGRSGARAGDAGTGRPGDHAASQLGDRAPGTQISRDRGAAAARRHRDHRPPGGGINDEARQRRRSARTSVRFARGYQSQDDCAMPCRISDSSLRFTGSLAAAGALRSGSCFRLTDKMASTDHAWISWASFSTR